MRREQVQYLVIAIGVAVVGWQLYSNFVAPRNSGLESEAPTSNQPSKRMAETPRQVQQRMAEQAPALRATLADTAQPTPSRSAAAEQLGEARDWESVPTLLGTMEDPSSEVRGRAGVAAAKILGADYGYRAEMPPAERAKIIQRMRRYYEARRNSPP